MNKSLNKLNPLYITGFGGPAIHPLIQKNAIPGATRFGSRYGRGLERWWLSSGSTRQWQKLMGRKCAVLMDGGLWCCWLLKCSQCVFFFGGGNLRCCFFVCWEGWLHPIKRWTLFELETRVFFLQVLLQFTS